MEKAFFHLPGLFEFYDFYKVFLPIFFEKRDYFYDWVKIGSIYGAPAGALWGGGRTGSGIRRPEDVLSLTEKFNISARLTFSNSLLKKEHLADQKCNALCRLFEGGTVENGVIVHSDLLSEYLKDKYPHLYLVSSTTKVLTDFNDFKKEAERDEFQFIVPDFRLNREIEKLSVMPQKIKDKTEFLVNECCYLGCTDRKACYENVSAKSLGLTVPDHICHSPFADEGYRFSRAMESPAFISHTDIAEKYIPMGFHHFKIEGRGLGSALLLEFILYYMTKPECQLKLREDIYLDNMLDLF